MTLRIRVRRTGKSLAITIPKAVAELHNIAIGDSLEIEPIGPGELRLRKAID
jgi:antitoxin component of MazEF toxin-antitoxin module